MSPEIEHSEEEIRDMDEKEFRKEFPSGWMELVRYETLVLIIDKLLESSPTREFTEAELAEQAGCSQASVEKHIDSLVRLGVVKELETREPIRYSLNEKSPITQKIYELNLTVEKVKDEELPKTISWDGNGTFRVSEDEQNSDGSQDSITNSQLKVDTSEAVQSSAPMNGSSADGSELKPSRAAFGAD